MADAQEAAELVEKKAAMVVKSISKSSIFASIVIFILIFIDWGIIPLSGMQGNVVIRFSIIGILGFELYSAFSMMRAVSERR